jgi:hypothetical protein
VKLVKGEGRASLAVPGRGRGRDALFLSFMSIIISCIKMTDTLFLSFMSIIIFCIKMTVTSN